MRTAWSVISFLAVVHFLALLMFIGWLWQSQRLTAERVGEVRAIFSMSEPEAHAAQLKAEQDAQAQAAQAAEEELKAHPPADSDAQIQSIALLHRQEQLARRRLEDEKSMLMQQLASLSADVEDQMTTLTSQQTGWEAEIQAERKRKTDEQFLQTVRQYEQVSPKQAKRMLIELIDDKQMNQAVEYLDAMNPRAAAKIMREFKTDEEIPLATELLEKLRTFGQSASQAGAAIAPKDPASANDLASAAP